MADFVLETMDLQETYKNSPALGVLENLVKKAMLDPAEGVRTTAQENLRNLPIWNGLKVRGGVGSEDRLYLKLQSSSGAMALAYVVDIPKEYLGKQVEIYQFSS